MCRPCPIQWNEPPCVDRPAENILWDKNALIPEQNLTPSRGICSVFAFPDSLKPIPVRVVAMFEPFVDEEICGVAVEGFADQLCHGEAGRVERGVMAAGHVQQKQ